MVMVILAAIVALSGPIAGSAAAAPESVFDLSASFGLSPDKDTIEPFTLYGTTFKKYLIEQLEGEKIVSRKRGFTVDTCVSSVKQAEETPQFQGLPTGEKVKAGASLVCRQHASEDLKGCCKVSCGDACAAALEAYATTSRRETGLELDAKDKARMQKLCSRQCAYECSKGGRTYDFVVPYRR